MFCGREINKKTITITQESPMSYADASIVSPAPSSPFPGDPLSVPYTGQARMRLALGGGFANGRVRVDPDAIDLIRVDPDFGPVPRLRADSASVRLIWVPSFGDWARLLLSGEQFAPEIVLHPAVEWSLAIRGGLSAVHLDLADGQIASIDIDGGCSDVDLELPEISQSAPIRIAGGASQVVLCRPPHVGVSVAIAGGASELQLDDQDFDALGGRIVLRSEGAGAGLPRYDIAVSGGASRLAIL
jgi:hypothetical protein